jgi:hypothetical protein
MTHGGPQRYRGRKKTEVYEHNMMCSYLLGGGQNKVKYILTMKGMKILSKPHN